MEGTSAPGNSDDKPLLAGRSRRWAWLAGLALVIAVVAISAELARPRELLDLLARAEPLWLFAALGLQASTYVAEGENWRVVIRAAGTRLPILLTCRLALAKLFVDQALPSAGLSGTYLIARGLLRAGVPRPTVMAAVVTDLTSYYFATILALLAALVIAGSSGRTSALVIGLTGLFVGVGLVIVAAVLGIARHRYRRLVQATRRIPLLRDLVGLLAEADPRIVRCARLHLLATLWQLVTLLCDTLTMASLLLAVGVHAPIPQVFANFMAASLFRTFSILPAGLGPFEAASVATLSLADIPVTAALSATLLFRAVSLLLPLIPGMLVARTILSGPASKPEA